MSCSPAALPRPPVATEGGGVPSNSSTRGCSHALTCRALLPGLGEGCPANVPHAELMNWARNGPLCGRWRLSCLRPSALRIRRYARKRLKPASLECCRLAAWIELHVPPRHQVGPSADSVRTCLRISEDSSDWPFVSIGSLMRPRWIYSAGHVQPADHLWSLVPDDLLREWSPAVCLIAIAGKNSGRHHHEVLEKYFELRQRSGPIDALLPDKASP